MLNGFIKKLMSPEAQPLREHFVFRIVPMLNPDGVVHGNYRCSQLGCDLNRKWHVANRLLHPSLFYSMQMMRMTMCYFKIQMFCDMHGHSRKSGTFFYGGLSKHFGDVSESRTDNALLRIIPLMCCQKSNLFELGNCRFHLD
jgi:cytosolic carboxypeptidase protein 2/3